MAGSLGWVARAAAVAMAVAAGGVVGLADVAAAATQCTSDPTGDTRVTEPKGDIVETCLTYDTDSVTVTVRMAQPSAPATDPYWQQEAGVLWALAATPDSTTAYVVAATRDGAIVFEGDETGETLTPVCTASLVFDGTRVVSTFAATCVGAPPQLYFGTVSVYDTAPADPNSDPVQDLAPDSETPSGPVARAGTTAPPPGPTDPVTRIAGPDRVTTAVLASQAGFTDGSAGGVVLASSENYPDALVGVPLAAANTAPVLLTPRDAVPDVVFNEIRRVLAGGKTVYLLGGTAAISDAVRARLEGAGLAVARLAGASRYDTAAAVADAVPNPAVILEATGRNFPDALAAGAAAGKAGGVVILTDGPTMPASSSAYIQAHGSAARFAIGGSAAQADPQATALVGANRYETATVVAARFFPSPATVGVASGANYPDALAGGLHALRAGGPLVLTAPTSLPTETASYLQANRSTITSGWVYGGFAAVSDQVVTALRQAIT